MRRGDGIYQRRCFGKLIGRYDEADGTVISFDIPEP